MFWFCLWKAGVASVYPLPTLLRKSVVHSHAWMIYQLLFLISLNVLDLYVTIATDMDFVTIWLTLSTSVGEIFLLPNSVQKHSIQQLILWQLSLDKKLEINTNVTDSNLPFHQFCMNEISDTYTELLMIYSRVMERWFRSHLVAHRSIWNW